jgi:uncharacterized protein (DUF486 family)
MKAILTILLLVASNIFMTFAWYGHLRFKEWFGRTEDFSILFYIGISWLIALPEYSLMVPANRLGFEGNGGPFSLFQLKIIQEVITLSVFVLFSILVFKNETLRWNHGAALFCIIMAVYFVFKK